MNKTVLLRKWLRDNEFDCTTKKGDEFCYSYSKECITWTNNNTEHDAHYMAYAKKLGLKYNINIKTISFLHELGHCELEDEYTVFDFLCERLKKYIEGDCPNKFILKLRANLYYRLPTERKATKWAVNFANYFQKETDELERIMVG